MKKTFSLFLFPLFFFFAFRQMLPAQLSATQIVQKAEQKFRGSTGRGEMEMTILRPDWRRSIRMKTWSKGDDYAMVLITAPAREKGMAFLKRGKELWNWQPTIERVIKMPPSMMAQSWMGSDFTNDDLVRQSSLSKDYEHNLLGEETIDGHPCYHIKLSPKEGAGIVWGHIEMWITKKDFLELKATFYDEDGELIHTMRGKDIKNMGGRRLPSLIEITPADEPENKTILRYLKLEFDQPIPDHFFSIQNMKRLK